MPHDGDPPSPTNIFPNRIDPDRQGFLVGCAIDTIEHRAARGWITPQQASAARLFERACKVVAGSLLPSSAWLRDFVDQSIDPSRVSPGDIRQTRSSSCVELRKP